MSAETRNYVYQVKVTDPNKKIPSISLETLRQFEKDVEKYLKKPDGTKV